MSRRRRVRPAVLALLVILVCTVTPAPAQTGRISGTVIDSTTAQPVANAEVSVLGTVLRAATSETGTYVIDGVRAGTYVLDVRRIGYVGLRRGGVAVTSDATTTVDFRLAASVFRLQEVVVTGVVGETEGVKLPFTVGRVDAAEAPVPPFNAVETVQGKVAGVTILPGGQPGSGTNILLRTPTSISKSNSPLLVVDGTILGTTTGITADLDPSDIESIEVVKGAAAASLYGSRAQAGVIQITTRRGRELEEGQTEVVLRSELGTNSLANKLHWAQYHHYLVDAAGQYIDTAGNVRTRATRLEERFQPDSSRYRFQDNAYSSPIYDQVETFFDPGYYLTNTISVGRRAGNTNWLGSYTNHGSAGVIDGHGAYRRNDARLNIDHSLRGDLWISASGYYSRSARDELDENTFFDLIHQAPDVVLRTPDPDGTPYIFTPDPAGVRNNPLYKLATEEQWTTRGRLLGSIGVRYTPTGWLSVDGNVSYDHADRYEFFFLDRGKKEDEFSSGGLGRIGQEHAVAEAINASLSVHLTHDFGGVTSRTTLRTLLEREDNVSSGLNGTDLAVPGVRDMNNARNVVPDNPLVNPATQNIRANGYFVITGLDYQGKYILDGLVRRDGSSLFGLAERWHTYGRFSAAYRLAQERWWPWPSVSEFKLRVSRGTAGGRPTFADQFETYVFGDGGAIEKTTLGNDSLRPERATETEYGLDLIAFNRFTVQLSYARSTVRDEIILVPLPAFYGFDAQWLNAGTVAGNTFEATVEAQILNTPALRWRAGLVFDRARHKVTEFDRSCFLTGTISYRCAGEPLGVMYGFRWLTSPGELPAIHAASRDSFDVNDDGLLVAVGTGTYQDRRWGDTVTVDGVPYSWGLPIPLRDAAGNQAVARIGDGNPNFHFAVSNEVQWKDFTIYGLVDVQAGGHVYNRTKQRMYQYFRSADVDQSGKPEGRKKPVDYYFALYAGNNVNSWFVEPGGFVKLRELSVRYRIPRSALRILPGLGIRNATLGIVGRNLFTRTKYGGYDPEIASDAGGAINRLDDFVYPRFRTVTGSVSIQF